jgi:hypothetical protein
MAKEAFQLSDSAVTAYSISHVELALSPVQSSTR